MSTFHSTSKGYRRGVVAGAQKMEHVVVWEAAHGPIPAGMQIHHINRQRDDNRLANLMLVTPLEHKRIHSGARLIDGVWWKVCRKCGEDKPLTVDHFYFLNGHPHLGVCRRCHIKAVVARKQAKRRVAHEAAEVAA